MNGLPIRKAPDREIQSSYRGSVASLSVLPVQMLRVLDLMQASHFLLALLTVARGNDLPDGWVDI